LDNVWFVKECTLVLVPRLFAVWPFDPERRNIADEQRKAMPAALYDHIGGTYTSTRHPDPRIAAAIVRALDDARTVVNVGAGAGAYEPTDRPLVAVEPSSNMIRQRAVGTAPVIQASAEALPFRDHSFEAALALLTLHHWTDWRCGLDEMRRVV
jgi:SAM-dependent methyltransferase